MNVLQILPAMDVGGVETVTLDLAKHITRAGHRCVVVSGPGRLVPELVQHNIKHYELPVGKKNPFLWYYSLNKLIHIIKQEDIAIVHAGSRVPAIIGFFAARKTGVKFITTCHGCYSYHWGSLIMAFGQRVIVPSTFVGRYMSEVFNVPQDRIRLVRGGVDIQQFPYIPLSNYPKHKNFKIAMIGRITTLKGHKDFLKAMQIVMQNINDVEAIVVGDAPKGKPYKRELEDLALHLGIQKKVHFIGSQRDIPGIMQSIDALILASIRPEACPRVIIEAQSSGVPVVAVNLGGVIDIVENEKTGLLVPSENPSVMADAILRLLKDFELAKNISSRARQNVEERFTLENMAKGTIDVYEEVLKEKRLLVFQIGSLGNAILSIPSIRALRENYPDARIDVVVDKRNVDVFERCPYINNCLLWDNRVCGTKNIFNLTIRIRLQCYCLSIDFQNSRLTPILSFLGLIPKRYGYRRGIGGFLLNKGIKYIYPHIGGPIKRQFQILEHMGITLGSEKLEFWTTKSDEEFADMIIKDAEVSKNQILVGFAPWTDISWKTKMWDVKNYAQVADKLGKELGARVIITGTKERTDDARLVVEYCVRSNKGGTKERTDDAKSLGSAILAKPINIVGRTTVPQLAGIFKRCNIVLTADSASMHLASALGVPVIAIFGPTDPASHVASENIIVLQSNLKCIKCYRKTCRRMQCMKDITVSRVIKEIGEKLVLCAINS